LFRKRAWRNSKEAAAIAVFLLGSRSSGICSQKIGYEVGGGIMVGIPGQTYNNLAKDILLFKELQLDIVGLGPFLPHPHTPLRKLFSPEEIHRQVMQHLQEIGRIPKKGREPR